MGKDTSSPTVHPSCQDTSIIQTEEEKSLSRASSGHNSQHEREKRVVETTPLDGAATLEDLSNDPEYPSGLKLGIIMASLSLSVFLMALVSPVLYVLTPRDMPKTLRYSLRER